MHLLSMCYIRPTRQSMSPYSLVLDGFVYKEG